MSDVYLIKKETLNAIAREMVNLAPDYLDADSIITPEDMARRMYEVKDQGYDDGFSDGLAESDLGQRVTNILGTTWNVPSGWSVPSAYATYYGEFEIYWNNTLYSDVTEIMMGYFAVTSVFPQTNWIIFKKSSGMGGTLQHTNTFKIKVKTIDTTTSSDPALLLNWVKQYGRFESGVDLEALGVLCDWEVTTDSLSYPTVTVINYHPSYFLHCTVLFDGDECELVVPPDDTNSCTFDFGMGFGQVMEIDIKSVRWSADGT